MPRPLYSIAISALALCLAVASTPGADAPSAKPRKKRRRPAVQYLDTTASRPLTNRTPAGVAHRFLKSGWASKSLAIVDEDGRVEWEHKDNRETSDAWALPDGGVIFSHSNGVTRLLPKKTVLWTYPAPKGTELHACQPLPGGGFLVGESGDGQWLVELDAAGKVRKKIHVSDYKNARHAFRHVRRTPEGTYLGTVMAQNKTYEWDAEGKLLRTFPNGHYVAIRLPNGHTLTSGRAKGKGYPIAEFDKQGKVVWTLTPADEKTLGFGLRMITGLQVLPNGNIVACNLLHGGPPKAPEVFEITRDKKVVWTLDDDRLNRIGSIHILNVPGNVHAGEVLR